MRRESNKVMQASKHMTVGMTDRNEFAHLAVEAHAGSHPVYHHSGPFPINRVHCPG